MSIKYKKMPGLLYDVIGTFVFKMNEKTKWLGSTIRPGLEDEDLHYFEYWLSKFDKPDDHLYLFFYRKDLQTPSCMTRIFSYLLHQYGEHLMMDHILDEIQSVDKMKQGVIQYYLPEVEKTMDLPSDYSTLIYQSDLDDKIRFLLTDFILNTKQYLDILKHDFMSYYMIVSEIYKERANELLGLQENMEQKEMQRAYELCYNTLYLKKHRRLKELVKQEYITFCLISRNTVWVKLYEDEDPSIWYIMGQNYQEILKIEEEQKIDLESIALIGNAVGDVNRAKILSYLLEEGELSSSEIAKRLGIALNTVSYHLQIMRDAKVLGKRNIGKSSYFWINSRICLEAAELFYALSKGGSLGAKIEELEEAEKTSNI